jgi:AcrR family transcriptional regulator
VEQTTKRTPSARGERALDARREEILAAATQLFAEHGYSDAVTQALVEKLQVGKGTLYRYFPSKRDLFLAAADRVMRKQKERIEAAIAGVEEPLERVSKAIRAHLYFYAQHPEFVELLIQERAQFKDRKTPTFFEYRNNNVKRWQEVWRSLIAQGRVRPMPVERITDVLSDLVYGTMFTNYFTGPRKPFEAQARDILDVVFFGILSESERSLQETRMANTGSGDQSETPLAGVTNGNE